jgi:predicted AlkP superfamily phosphohydrolase/phosphomutase
MNYSKVEGHVNLVRDQKTKAILNTDMNEYNNYIALRDSKKSHEEKINHIENDLSDLKNDINEIKSLLRGLVDGPR